MPTGQPPNFCGRKSVPGKGYCAEHAARCYKLTMDMTDAGEREGVAVSEHGRARKQSALLALVEPKDGEHCKKLRHDLGDYRCRRSQARDLAMLPHVRRTDPARYELALATMKTQRPHGLRVIAEAKALGPRAPQTWARQKKR